MGAIEGKRYASLRDKMAAERAERDARYAEYAKAWAIAVECGLAAGKAAIPEPMTVVDGFTGRHIETVADGSCGFAWVTVHPGNSSFARWAAKKHGAKKAYGGGMQVYWVSHFNQSLTRKEAFARAFAQSLRDSLRIEAFSGSRMD